MFGKLIVNSHDKNSLVNSPLHNSLPNQLFVFQKGIGRVMFKSTNLANDVRKWNWMFIIKTNSVDRWQSQSVKNNSLAFDVSKWNWMLRIKLQWALLNGITLGRQAISDYNNQIIKLYKLPFTLNEAHFRKKDLVKRPKPITLSNG
jgi:hypothetical protein